MPDIDFASPPTFQQVGVVNYVPTGEAPLPNVALVCTSIDGPGLYLCLPNDDTYTVGTWTLVAPSAGGGGTNKVPVFCDGAAWRIG